MQRVFTSFKVISTFSLVILMTIGAFADTIRLKDGSIIKGRITSFGGGKFVVVIGEGSRRKNMSFVAAEIDSIQFDDRTMMASAPQTSGSDISRASYEPRIQPVRPQPARTYSNTSNRPSPAPTARASIPATTPPASQVRTVRPTPITKPVEIAVKVLADNTANGWTNTGFVVKRGQRVRVSGEGKISLGGGKTSEPEGLHEVEDGGKLLKSVPTGALIAVIGDDNNDFIYVGSNREFTASRDGSLFLGVNEGNLNDNSGSYNVKVQITPADGS